MYQHFVNEFVFATSKRFDRQDAVKIEAHTLWKSGSMKKRKEVFKYTVDKLERTKKNRVKAYFQCSSTLKVRTFITC